MSSSSHSAMLTEVLDEVFGSWSARTQSARDDRMSGWSSQLWATLAEAGFPWISLPEDRGGSGGEPADAFRMLMTAGGYAAPVPLAETSVLGGWMLARAGLALPDGPVTLAVGRPGDVIDLVRHGSGWRVTGSVNRVPWGRHAQRVVLLVAPSGALPQVVSVPVADAAILPIENFAGEPRDTVNFAGVVVSADDVAEAPPDVTPDAVRLRGALARAALIAGALQQLSRATNRYATEREQFGRPIARFQAVQTHLVQLAEDAALAGLATSVAYEAVRDELPQFQIASAKALASLLAGNAVAAAHQVHGAIGMTQEHHLHTLTRRLWAWRDEFGSESFWNRQIGLGVAAHGADSLWRVVVDGAFPR